MVDALVILMFKSTFETNVIFKRNQCSEYLNVVNGIFLFFFFQEVFVNSKKCKGLEKRDCCLVSKMEFDYQFTQRDKSFTCILFS